MSIKKKEVLCRCGHSKYVHDTVNAPIWESWCNAGGGFGSKSDCSCNEFRLDNLSYIENCYEIIKKKGTKKS